MSSRSHIGPNSSSLGHRLTDTVKLIRPLNAIIMATGVVLGGYLAHGMAVFLPSASIWYAAVTTMLIGAGANALNDAIDVTTDRVNRPDRPVASGRVSVRMAQSAGIVLIVVGLIMAWLDSIDRGVVASIAALLLVCYNISLGRTIVVGNVVVSAVVGLSLVFGAIGNIGLSSLIAPPEVGLWCGVFFAFMMTWAREIVKDVEDEPGDRLDGYRTTPIIWGQRRARQLAAGILTIVVVCGPLPYLIFSFSGTYLLAMLVTLSAVIRIVVGLFSEHFDASSVSRSLKWAMLAGMASLATFDWNAAVG